MVGVDEAWGRWWELYPRGDAELVRDLLDSAGSHRRVLHERLCAAADGVRCAGDEEAVMRARLRQVLSAAVCAGLAGLDVARVARVNRHTVGKALGKPG